MAVRNVQDDSVEVRRTVAGNVNASARDLAQLANDVDVLVRVLVYLNPNSTEEVKEETDISDDFELVGVYADEADPGSWGDDEWEYHVADGDPAGLDDNAVWVDADGRWQGSPDWWTDTINFVNPLNFDCTLEEFLDVDVRTLFLSEEFNLSEDDWQQALIDLYEARKANEEEFDFMCAAAEILYPDYDFAKFKVDSPYNNGDWLKVFYDADYDYMYPDEFQTWYFWDVYEARTKFISVAELIKRYDFEDLVFDAVNCPWDLFDSGEYGDDWSWVTGEEYREMERNDALLTGLAHELGYRVQDCVLI